MNSASLPAGAAALLESYSASGAGGSPGTSTYQGTGSVPGVPDPVEQEPSLCEARLLANHIICGVGGGLIARDLGLDGFLGQVASIGIGDACIAVGDWLEHNAPLGACGDE